MPEPAQIVDVLRMSADELLGLRLTGSSELVSAYEKVRSGSFGELDMVEAAVLERAFELALAQLERRRAYADDEKLTKRIAAITDVQEWFVSSFGVAAVGERLAKAKPAVSGERSNDPASATSPAPTPKLPLPEPVPGAGSVR